jgi:hypothetical protein
MIFVSSAATAIYRSVRIIIVAIMIDAVVLVIVAAADRRCRSLHRCRVAAAAAVILLPPGKIHLFNPSGGDAGNRIDGRGGSGFSSSFLLFFVPQPTALRFLLPSSLAITASFFYCSAASA